MSTLDKPLKQFIMVIVTAAVLGGFVGGEISDDRTFSITGAVIGGAGLAVVLLGLGAYFDAQARKSRDKALPPEMRAVFEGVVARATARQRRTPSLPVKHAETETPEAGFFSSMDLLITMQLVPAFDHPRKAFSKLMTNRRAAGYVFGFHDAFLEELGTSEHAQKRRADLIEQSYKRLFGEQAGYALFSHSVAFQDDPTFCEARLAGGNELIDFVKNKVPPFGLGRMLVLGMKT